MPSALILAITLEPRRPWGQALAMQSAGYKVVAAYSLQEAINCFQYGDFDLVLFDDSIRAKDRDCLVQSIRGSGSHIPIVSMEGDCGELAASSQFPPEDGQTEFIDFIKNALEMERVNPRDHCVYKWNKHDDE